MSETVLQRYEELGRIMIGKAKLKERNGKIPEGGISLMDAERKYRINNETISKWTRQGYIPIILRTANELYIDDSIMSKIANIWKSNPGRGKWTIRKIMKELTTSHS